MATMEERFKRAFKVLDDDAKTWDYETKCKVLYDNELCLMWLRNRASLWVDYEEDESWIINGINYDPNHPDNLSDSVYKLWQQVYKD